MTDALIVSTAPVFEVDGTPRGELARDLIRLEIEETTAGLKILQARFLAVGAQPGGETEGQLYLDGSVFDFGRKIQVSIGAASEARIVFQGFMSALEVNHEESVPPEVVVFAEDRLMDLRMTRRFKTYTDVSDADIARAIASEHGLSAEVDADGPTYKVVQQWNMSDLAFLRKRAALLQADIGLLEEKLYFQTRDKRTSSAITLVQGNHIISATARADLAHQRTKVMVSGYDASNREGFTEVAGSDVVDADISGGLTGVAVLERAFGERVSYRVREVPIESGEASAWARAEMLRRARGFVSVSGVTRGTPDMVVGSRLTLERMGQPFDGPGYYATRVCHTYDAVNAYRTRFTAERATVQEAA